MNRKQLYSEITSLKLQEEVKNRYGDNYTRCSNEQLQKLVDEVHSRTDATWSNGPVVKLVEILAKKKILLKSEVEAIMKA